MRKLARVLNRAVRSVWGWPGLRVLLLCCLICILAAWIWAPRLRSPYVRMSWLHSLQVGDLGEYVQGIALLGAVWVALRDSRRSRREQLRAERIQAEREGTRVYAWMVYEEAAVEPGWYAVINNMTPMPIGLWVMTVKDSDNDDGIGVLDAAHQLPLQPGMHKHRLDLGHRVVDRASSIIKFVDVSGACWERDSTGSLSAIDRIVVGDQVLAKSIGSTGTGGRSDKR
jgi:hypothetical protein